MDSNLMCKDCAFLNEDDCRGTFLYEYRCNAIQQYVSLKTPACSMFVQRTKKRGWLVSEPSDHAGCYLTTACVNYRGLADDCKELTLLRHFRDTYVKSLPNGDELISTYYDTAPAIVEKINERVDAKEIYADIYSTILECVKLIEENSNEETLKLYKAMVEKYKVYTEREE